VKKTAATLVAFAIFSYDQLTISNKKFLRSFLNFNGVLGRKIFLQSFVHFGAPLLHKEL